MNILHYTIGLPPTRHGGSVQYAFDLMKEQAKNNKVYALICGDTLFRSNRCTFKPIGNQDGFKTYKLTNPTTPSLLYGMKDPQTQMRKIKIDTARIKRFITSNNIEIFHIHTLMGLSPDVVKFVKSLNVKIIYTTHDFYGICPHTNLLDYDGLPCKSASPERCAKCNMTAPSDFFMRLCNSSLYHLIKSCIPISKGKVITTTTSDRYSTETPNHKIISGFSLLLDFYKKYFSLIDLFIFNSTQTQNIFKEFIPFAKGITIPVVTNGIKDLRAPLTQCTKIRLGYIGNLKDYKGFSSLRSTLLALYNEGFDNWELNVYGAHEGEDTACNNIHYKGHYSHENISDILYLLDGVIVPSKWYETFSLVTLEALAHGRPTLVSSTVGAKDIVRKLIPEMIFTNSADLYEKLKRIISNKSILIDLNQKILMPHWPYNISFHTQEVLNAYK